MPIDRNGFFRTQNLLNGTHAKEWYAAIQYSHYLIRSLFNNNNH